MAEKTICAGKENACGGKDILVCGNNYQHKSRGWYYNCINVIRNGDHKDCYGREKYAFLFLFRVLQNNLLKVNMHIAIGKKVLFLNAV